MRVDVVRGLMLDRNLKVAEDGPHAVAEEVLVLGEFEADDDRRHV